MIANLHIVFFHTFSILFLICQFLEKQKLYLIKLRFRLQKILEKFYILLLTRHMEVKGLGGFQRLKTGTFLLFFLYIQ